MPRRKPDKTCTEKLLSPEETATLIWRVYNALPFPRMKDFAWEVELYLREHDRMHLAGPMILRADGWQYRGITEHISDWFCHNWALPEPKPRKRRSKKEMNGHKAAPVPSDIKCRAFYSMPRPGDNDIDESRHYYRFYLHLTDEEWERVVDHYADRQTWFERSARRVRSVRDAARMGLL